jgi:Leucine-rich repeat (LRR) protein
MSSIISFIITKCNSIVSGGIPAQNEKVTISSLPSDAVSLAIGFYGNPNNAGNVCKSWQKNRADAFYEILDGYKQDLRISQIISAFMPTDGSEPQWANIAENTRQNLINQARTLGIKVQNPQEISLSLLLDQIELENDAHLLRCFDRIVNEIPEDVPNFLLEGTTTARASAIRTWMAANQGVLATIQELDLSNANLWVLPPEIIQLTNLQTLRLDDNQLTSLPATFGRLTNLRLLNLRQNRLISLPITFGQLVHLRTLNLSHNRLTSLPSTFDQLINLEWLYLNHNQLTSLPLTFGGLTNLRWLRLNHNQLTSLPSTFGELINLKWLYLNHNQIVSLPSTFSRFSDLQKAVLDPLPATYQYAQSILSNISNRLFPSLNPSSLLEDIDLVK